MWNGWYCHYIYFSLSDLGYLCQGHLDLLLKKINYTRVVTSRTCSDAQKRDASSRFRQPTV